jgi:hypothetical protein
VRALSRCVCLCVIMSVCAHRSTLAAYDEVARSRRSSAPRVATVDDTDDTEDNGSSSSDGLGGNEGDDVVRTQRASGGAQRQQRLSVAERVDDALALRTLAVSPPVYLDDGADAIAVTNATPTHATRTLVVVADNDRMRRVNSVGNNNGTRVRATRLVHNCAFCKTTRLSR